MDTKHLQKIMIKGKTNRTWKWENYNADVPVLRLVFKEGFSCCLKLILVCFSCDLFHRYMHKMSLPTYFFISFSVFFSLIVGHLTSCDSCNLHVSPRSSGQSPLWLPTPNHSSRPSRVSLSLTLSPSLFLFSLYM